MTLLPTGLCVIGLLSAYLIAHSLDQLRPNKEEILRFFSAFRINFITLVFLLTPVLVGVILAVLITLYYQDSFLIRGVHAVFVLGLWMLLTLAIFVLVVITRLGIKPSLSTLAAPILAVPLVAFLTPLGRFSYVFDPSPLSLPGLVGLLMVGVSYFLIWQIRIELL